jgi:hypothetical protein
MLLLNYEVHNQVNGRHGQLYVPNNQSMQFYRTVQRTKPQTEKEQKKIITEQMSAALSL